MFELTANLENNLMYFVIFASIPIVISLAYSKNILTIALLNSCFSLFTVIMYSILDAPDVAMTEAAVGVLTSIFAIYTIKYLYQYPYSFEDKHSPLLFILCLILAACLIYA